MQDPSKRPPRIRVGDELPRCATEILARDPHDHGAFEVGVRHSAGRAVVFQVG